MPLQEDERITAKPGLEQEWEDAVEKNRDAYGYGVVQATVAVCKALDEGQTPKDASEAAYGLGITGFMAGCMTQWISHFHPRGDEFRRWWNLEWQIHDEGEKANEKGTVLNPAILNIG